MKYAWGKILLEAQGVTTSDISRGISISRASGSSSHRVNPRIDEANSRDSAHTLFGLKFV